MYVIVRRVRIIIIRLKVKFIYLSVVFLRGVSFFFCFGIIDIRLF